MSKVAPPFRADHVGSLLRPPAIHVARGRRARRRDRRRRAARASRTRRSPRRPASSKRPGCAASPTASSAATWFHLDFLAAARRRRRRPATSPPAPTPPETVHMTPPKLSVVGPLRHVRDIQVDDFRYLAPTAPQDAEGLDPVADDGPLPRRAGGDRHRGVPRPRRVLRRPRRSATATRSTRSTPPGCRYLQLDDTNLAYLCDPVMRAGRRRARRRPRRAAAHLRRADQRTPSPAGPTTSPSASTSAAATTAARGSPQGGYEPVAEVLFNELDVDAYFLEYDDERSGDFAPLRFVPADKTVVLGLVTSKRRRARADDELRGTDRRGGRVRAVSTSCASARSAASPARSRATRSPRTSSGPSSATSSRSPNRSGTDELTRRRTWPRFNAVPSHRRSGSPWPGCAGDRSPPSGSRRVRSRTTRPR